MKNVNMEEIFTDSFVKISNGYKLYPFELWRHLMKPVVKLDVNPEDWLDLLHQYVTPEDSGFNIVVKRHVRNAYTSVQLPESIDEYPSARYKTPVSNNTKEVINLAIEKYHFPMLRYFYNLLLDRYISNGSIAIGGTMYYFNSTNASAEVNSINYPTVVELLNRASSDPIIVKATNGIFHGPYKHYSGSVRKAKLELITMLKNNLTEEESKPICNIIEDAGWEIINSKKDRFMLFLYMSMNHIGCPRVAVMAGMSTQTLERYLFYVIKGVQFDLPISSLFYIPESLVVRSIDIYEIRQSHPENSKEYIDAYYRNIKNDEWFSAFIYYMDMGKAGFIEYVLEDDDYTPSVANSVFDSVYKKYYELRKYVLEFREWIEAGVVARKTRASEKLKITAKTKSDEAVEHIKTVIEKFLQTNETNFDEYCKKHNVTIGKTYLSRFKESYPEEYDKFKNRIDSDPNSGINKSKQSFAIHMSIAKRMVELMLDHEVNIVEFCLNCRMDVDVLLGFIKNLNLSNEDMRKVRCNLNLIKSKQKSMNVAKEYESKTILAGIEVELDQKKLIVSVMSRNKLPLYRTIYIELLREFVKEGNLTKYGLQ